MYNANMLDTTNLTYAGFPTIRLTESEWLNEATFCDYYNRLQLLARSVFKWTGLPNGIPEKFIERILFEFGVCVFFDHPSLGLMVAKLTQKGTINYYDEPASVQAYGTGLDPVDIDFDKCVLIRNNDMMLPTSLTNFLYASRLTEVERTLDVNIKAQKCANIIQCNDKQLLTIKNPIKKWKANEPFIVADKKLDLSEMKVLNTASPFVSDKLLTYKHDLWNEYMTFLGLNNVNTDKKERLVVDEANANNQLIEASFNVMYKQRKLACEQINAMFKTHINVEARNPREIEELTGIKIGGDSNGNNDK